MLEGKGSSEDEECITALDKFLKSSGKINQYPSLPKISINQVSDIVSTTKIQPAKESTAKNSERTSRPRSAKEDKKNIAKIRDASKNYIITFNIIFTMIIIITTTVIIIIIIFQYIKAFYFNYNALGTSKTRRNHRSPSRESTDEENMELFSTPDRSATNLKKNSGKSTLKGNNIYDYYLGVA